MPNPYVNKVTANNVTLIDLTADTVTASTLMQGYTAHDASGAPITGTASAGRSYTITLSDQGHATNCYVQLNHVGTIYYTSNTTIDFQSGDELYIHCRSGRAGGTIAVNGDTVASTTSGAAEYTLELPDSDIMVDLSYGLSTASIDVTIPSISITTNGVHDVSDYALADVNVPTGGGDSYTLTTVVPQQTFTPTTNQNNAYQAELTYTSGLVSGEPYIITYDGVEYVCDCSDPLWGSDRMMGTIAAMWGDRGNGVFPFAVDYSGGNMYVASFDLNQHTIKIEHLEFVDGPLNLITKSITSNGTYTASSDNADGYSSVTVNVSGGGTPRTSADLTVSGATVTAPAGVYASDASKSVASMTLPTAASATSSGTSKSTITPGSSVQYLNIPTGYNGTASYYTISATSGSSKNAQVAQSTSRATSSTYTSVCSLTCSTAGTYDVYWDCFRSTTGGTSGSQLYIGGSAYGSANTTFSNHAQTNHLTGVTLAKNQTVAVYARSRGSNYYAYVSQLTIVQTA